MHASITTALLFVGTLSAQTTYTGNCSVHFRGTSTLHDFEGDVYSKSFEVSISEDSAWSANADLAVSKMDTHNSTRDAKMRKMFDSETFGIVSGVVENARVPSEDDKNCMMRVKIRDIKLPVPVTLDLWQVTENKLEIKGSCAVSLKDFELKPPRVAGVIRVGDTVNVEIHVEAKPTQNTPKKQS